MKLNPRNVSNYCGKPDPSKAGLLIYGADSLRVASLLEKTTLALVGPSGKDEFRLLRLAADEVQRDGGELAAAVKSQSFFPGQRAVVVENAADGIVKAVEWAFKERAEGDAPIIVTAGMLRPASKLRKLFEGHKNAYCAPVYADQISSFEIKEAVKNAGLKRVSPSAMSDIEALGKSMSPQALRLFLDKIALYKLSDDSEVAPDDVEACASDGGEMQLDDLMNAVADGHPEKVCAAIRRLCSQGYAPISICIIAQRMFRNIFLVASDPSGPEVGIARIRPPVLGRKKQRLQQQAMRWKAKGAESALLRLGRTDRYLRSGRPIPALEAVEGTLVRIAKAGKST